MPPRGTQVRQGQIRGGEPQYADLLEEIADIKTAILSLSGDATNIVNSINSLDNRVTVNESEIISLSSQVGNILNEINSINFNITDIYQELSQLPTQSVIDDLQSDISDLQIWLDDLEVDLSQTQGDLLSLSGDVSTLEINVNDLFIDVGNIEITVGTIQNYLSTTLEERLETLEELLVEQGFQIVYNGLGAIERLVFDDNTETVLVYDLQGNVSQVITPTVTKTLLYDTEGRLVGVEVT